MKILAQLLRDYFAEAGGHQTRETFFRIAGRTVAMRFAEDRWIDTFSKALAHLEAAPESADLTLYLWDGVREPENHFLRAYLFTLTNWWYDYTGPRGQLLDVDSRALAAFYDPLSGLLSVLDYGEGCGFLWKRDQSEMPYFETCAPARVLLHAWLRSRDCQMVHGAAVGNEEGGVLLVGPGGSGKSTSALACLDSDLKYLSDDYCIVEKESGGFRAHSLYGAAKLVDDRDLARFPSLAGGVWNRRGPGEKAALFINEQRPQKLIAEFPVRAIVVPKVTGLRETTLASCSPALTLEALAPSTMAQMPASGANDLAFMAEMVRSLPCYSLLAGTELSQISEALGGLLTRAPAAGMRV